MTKPLPAKSLVLYADDDPDDRLLVGEAFQAYAQTIDLVTFPDGVSLLRFVERRNAFPAPCLIILDINMPMLNGKETLKQLRGLDHMADVPAVLFTTSTLPAEAAFARAHKAGFLTKPLDEGQMIDVIDQFIDHCGEETKKQIRRYKKG
ncbi:MAG TPA: response regulator [Flavisolibacter sp.]|nr:response regulator [Flavisolibacter sp.]